MDKTEKYREARRKRADRLVEARARGTHTMYDWCCLVAATGGTCPRCEQPATQFDKDHVIPIYAGGSDAIDNLQPLCARCNASKGPEQLDWAKIKGLR